MRQYPFLSFKGNGKHKVDAIPALNTSKHISSQLQFNKTKVYFLTIDATS